MHYILVLILYNIMLFPAMAIDYKLNSYINQSYDGRTQTVNLKVRGHDKNLLSSLEEEIKAIITPPPHLSPEELLENNPNELDIYLCMSNAVLPNQNLNWEFDLSLVIQKLLYIGDKYKNTYIFPNSIDDITSPTKHEKIHELNNYKLLPILIKMIQGKKILEKDKKVLHNYEKDLKSTLTYKRHDSEWLKNSVINFVRKYINPYSEDFLEAKNDSIKLGFYKRKF